MDRCPSAWCVYVGFVTRKAICQYALTPSTFLTSVDLAGILSNSLSVQEKLNLKE